MEPLPAHHQPISPTQDEIAAIREAEATLHPRARERTVAALFKAWRGLVAEAESGYLASCPEWSHDVLRRTALDRIWPLLPERPARIWLEELEQLDERFRTATIPWPGRDENDPQWWKQRIPRRLEIEPDEPLNRGWPLGWEMVPGQRPLEVELT